MPSITIKDIPPELHAALKASATAHHRSLNQEIIYQLSQGVRSRRATAQELNKAAAEIRARIAATTGLPPIDEEILQKAKRTGREE